MKKPLIYVNAQMVAKNAPGRLRQERWTFGNKTAAVPLSALLFAACSQIIEFYANALRCPSDAINAEIQIAAGWLGECSIGEEDGTEEEANDA